MPPRMSPSVPVSPGKAKAKFTPASKKQTIATGCAVFAVALIVAGGWFVLFGRIQHFLDKEYRVAWTPGANVIITSGPTSFYVDTQGQQLVTRGPIDANEKQQLAGLVTKNGQTLFPPDPAGESYWEALDHLAYTSNASGPTVDLWLLILGGVSGFLGVSLRSIINFVGVTCYRNELDVVRWWPWYALRPAIGFIFGFAAVLLIRVGFFQAETASTSTLNWALVIALLAGFGATEFADRLRLLSKTLFGESSGERKI